MAYEIGDDVEYKGSKGKVIQVVHLADKVEYLVRFEDGTEKRVSLDKEN